LLRRHRPASVCGRATTNHPALSWSALRARQSPKALLAPLRAEPRDRHGRQCRASRARVDREPWASSPLDASPNAFHYQRRPSRATSSAGTATVALPLLEPWPPCRLLTWPAGLGPLWGKPMAHVGVRGSLDASPPLAAAGEPPPAATGRIPDDLLAVIRVRDLVFKFDKRRGPFCRTCDSCE